MLIRLAPLVLFSGLCLAQDAARMDQIVQTFVANNQFMGTALVARGDQVLFNKGYGSANLEWNIPATPDTAYQLASVSKWGSSSDVQRGGAQVDC